VGAGQAHRGCSRVVVLVNAVVAVVELGRQQVVAELERALGVGRQDVVLVVEGGVLGVGIQEAGLAATRGAGHRIGGQAAAGVHRVEAHAAQRGSRVVGVGEVAGGGIRAQAGIGADAQLLQGRAVGQFRACRAGQHIAALDFERAVDIPALRIEVADAAQQAQGLGAAAA